MFKWLLLFSALGRLATGAFGLSLGTGLGMTRSSGGGGGNGGGASGPLDGLSVRAAWGMRQLLSTYSGSLIRLRRGSDSAESDFGFDENGDLDAAAIATWLGGTNGFLRAWYDQSGNGYDVAPTSTGDNAEPHYIASGISSKPVARFSLSRLLSTTNATLIALPETYDMAVVAVTRPLAVSTNGVVWAWDGTDDLYFYPNDNAAGSGGIRAFWRDLGGNIISEAGSNLTNTNMIVSFSTAASNDHRAYRNGSQVGSSTGTGSAGAFSSFVMGRGSTSQYDGYIGELVILSAASDRAAAETAANDYWAVHA